MIFLAGLAGSLVIRMVGSAWPRPATASCRSVPGYLVSLAPGVSMTRTRRVLAPARAIVIAVQALAGRAFRAAVSLGVRARSVMNVMPRSVSWPSWVWVVTLLSMMSSFGSWPVTWCQWSAKARTSLFWVALARSALA